MLENGRFAMLCCAVPWGQIIREIQAELGKSDEEMEDDPFLSTLNLMRFEPDAEEGDFQLKIQV